MWKTKHYPSRWIRATGSVVLLVTLMVASLSASSSASGNGKTVTWGFIGSFSGPYAPDTVGVYDALIAFVNYTNAHGGIDGAHLAIKHYDDTGSPTEALTVTREALDAGINVFYGPLAFPESVEPIENQSNFINFVQTSDPNVANPSLYPNTFVFYPPLSSDESAVVDYLKARHLTKWALLSDTISTDTTEINGIASMASKAGATVVSNTSFPVTQTTGFGPLAQKIESAKPDVVVMLAEGPGVAGVLNQFSADGFDVPVVGNAGLGASGAMPDISHSEQSRVFGSQPNCYDLKPNGAPASVYQPLAKLLYSEVGKSKLLSESPVGCGQWDLFAAMKLAEEKAGGDNPSKMRQFLENDFHNVAPLGPGGVEYSFSKTDHNAFKSNDPGVETTTYSVQSSTWPGFNVVAPT